MEPQEKIILIFKKLYTFNYIRGGEVLISVHSFEDLDSYSRHIDEYIKEINSYFKDIRSIRISNIRIKFLNSIYKEYLKLKLVELDDSELKYDVSFIDYGDQQCPDFYPWDNYILSEFYKIYKNIPYKIFEIINLEFLCETGTSIQNGINKVTQINKSGPLKLYNLSKVDELVNRLVKDKYIGKESGIDLKLLLQGVEPENIIIWNDLPDLFRFLFYLFKNCLTEKKYNRFPWKDFLHHFGNSDHITYIADNIKSVTDTNNYELIQAFNDIFSISNFKKIK